MRLQLPYAFHEPCDLSAPKVMNAGNAALYNSREFNKIRLDSPSAFLVVTTSASGKSIIRMKGTFHAKKCRKVGEPEYLFRNFSYIHQFGTSLRCTLAEHNFTLRIGYTRRSQPDIRRTHALILHLHFVVENGVREHDLELASCEVASRTGKTPVSERQ